jgi:Protein of unknown function (DUF2877)
MNLPAIETPMQLCSIGEAASRLLSDVNQVTVLASVTDANYLQDSSDELCWLIAKSVPMHQRGIEVAASLPRMKPGSRYQITSHTLEIDPGRDLDLHHCPIWKPPDVSSTCLVALPESTSSIRNFIGRLLAQHQPTGFGNFIASILQLTVHQNFIPDANLYKGIFGKAWSAVQRMIQASMVNDQCGTLDNASYLIGFGEGLTPSGDDFIGGFFYSRWLLSNFYPQYFDGDQICTYSDFIARSKPLTNLISYTILKDNSEGHTVEPLHLLANGLLQGEKENRLIRHAERLIFLGHSTGWDLLTGFFAGILATSIHRTRYYLS